MAFSHEFDPSKGFVALPTDIMDIDMSPGAFRLLVELCRMANRTGECWPSLAQLSERIGRSKAAISGYITELRLLELLATHNQKMANGYNYRLKYCVTFWQSWRAQLASAKDNKPAKKTECSVQPIERRVNSKNHIHKNKTDNNEPSKASKPAKLVSVYSRWSELTKASIFPSFNQPVSNCLIVETQNILAQSSLQPLSMDRLKTRLTELWCKHSVTLDKSEVQEQAKVLAKNGTTHAGISALEQCVQAKWQKHWRKLPSPEQFSQLLSEAQILNKEEGMLRMLKQYLKRWEIVQDKLQHGATSPNLLLNQAA